jgi:type VI secretion system ImpA family protein
MEPEPMLSSPAIANTPPGEAAPQESAFAAYEGGYFQRQLGISLERLLAPLDGPLPAGPPVRGSMMFRMVEQARRSDDPSLPMGAWVAEPRRANWPKVSSLAAGLLADTAKDLQLAAWLLEAEIHQRGYAAIAPGIALMHGLCERWWSGLHPQGEDGDFESRANVVRWVDEKLLPTVSLAPLAAHGERSASWTHWELAHHYERIRAAKGELPEEAANAPGLDDLHALLAAMPADALRSRHGELALARAAIAGFEESLGRRFASEPPTLGRLDTLLARAQAPLHGELARRGEPLPGAAARSSDRAEADRTETDETEAAVVEVTDRDRAYRMLQEIADFLACIEPHSPVPYLLRRAVAWGGLNTAELYRELFVKGNAQLDLFDLLGVAAENRQSAE